MKDGRVLYGEITQSDKATGSLTFQDRYGATLQISKEEYTYIVQDKKYKTQRKDTVLQVRKYNDFEFELGFGANFYSFTHTFTADTLFLKSDWEGSRTIVPINVHAGFGRYIKRNGYIGADINVGMTTQGKTAFSAGIVGRFIYDNHTSNIAKYIAVTANYQNTSSTINYFVSDSLGSGTGTGYPGKYSSSLVLSSFNIGISHGFQFQLQFLRSFTIDLGVFKQFGTYGSMLFYKPQGSITEYRPKSTFSGYGATLFLAYHF